MKKLEKETFISQQTYLSIQVTKFYEVLSSIDIEVNKTVFIYFFYERYFKCKKHKKNPLSNIQPNIFKQKKKHKQKHRS